MEPRTGVFLGNPSARVRDELWIRAIKAMKGQGTVLQVWPDQNPQGFSYRQFGISDRKFVDLEGLALVQTLRRDTREPQDSDTSRCAPDTGGNETR